jgi:hypothetical protein
MATCGELGIEPSVDNVKSRDFGDDAGAERQDVGVVVLARHLGFEVGGDVRGADAGNFVGDDGHANARAAGEDSEIGMVLGDVLGDSAREVGIVARFSRVGALVVDGYAALEQVIFDSILQLETCVVGAKGDLHASSFRFLVSSFKRKSERPESVWIC